MTEKTRKLIVYGALVLAVIWGIYNFSPKNKTGSATESNALSPISARAETHTTAVEKSINIAEMKSKSWGNDPFRATNDYTSSPVKTEDIIWRLSGIVYNSVKPLAIINGKSVSVGSKLGSATIVAINKESVILELSGTQITLKVSKG